MLRHDRITLTEYLIRRRRAFPHATGEFNAMILQIAQACKAISRALCQGSLAEVPQDSNQAITELANRIFLQTTHWSGSLAGMLGQQEARTPIKFTNTEHLGKYLLIFDALDGAASIDVNAPVGSIFSVLRTPILRQAAGEKDFLQPGTEQIAAGYAIYGPATMLVLSVGDGVSAFTFDVSLGDFFLTHEEIRIPESSSEFAINASNSRFWEAPVSRYVEECLAGRSGQRGRDFNMRWMASLVAETHRILMRGGVFLYPQYIKDANKPAPLLLLHKANPIAFLIEQAGGRASTGMTEILTQQPKKLDECSGLIFGSQQEVELIEQYHREPANDFNSNDLPLFNARSLFLQH